LPFDHSEGAYSWCYGPYFKSGNLAHLSGSRAFSSSYKIALSLCEEILAFSHAFGSLAVRRVAL